MNDQEKRKIIFVGFYIIILICLVWVSYDLIKTRSDLQEIKKDGSVTVAMVKDIVLIPVSGKPPFLEEYYFEFKNNQNEVVTYKYDRAITGEWKYKKGDWEEITFQKSNPKNFVINSKLDSDLKTSITIIVCSVIALCLMTFRKALRKLI